MLIITVTDASTPAAETSRRIRRLVLLNKFHNSTKSHHKFSFHLWYSSYPFSISFLSVALVSCRRRSYCVWLSFFPDIL